MPVITHVKCCDYHAGPIDDPYHRRQTYSWRYPPGEYAAMVTVPRRLTMLREYLADAVTHDHDCEDAGCDIAAAMANGYVLAAYHLLIGATEPHACDALVGALERVHGVDAVRDVIGADLYSCADWDGWKAHHDQYGRMCASCGGCTYAEHGWEPTECAHCGAHIGPVDDDS